MNKQYENLFGYLDELTFEELCNFQKVLISDIEYSKIKKDNNIDFEVERLKYVTKLIEQKNKQMENEQQKLSM